MTRRDEIDAEIRNQAVRLYSRCTALFELPTMVYWQIMQDNTFGTSRTGSVRNTARRSSLQCRSLIKE